jgi:Ser/Thr protein kinase RdoA (MazF antagonist)
MADFPRVYDLALELIAHVDGRIDSVHLTSFIAAYQEVTPLKLGELWAIPIMLRLALIEICGECIPTDRRAQRPGPGGRMGRFGCCR